jgi:putative nucleotidyltransferase with HDIG domain
MVAFPRVATNLKSRQELVLHVYAALLIAESVAFAAALWIAGFEVRGGYAVLVLCAVAAIAERWAIPLTPAVEVTVASMPFILAAVLFGPLAAMIVGATGLLVVFGRPYVRWGVWTAVRTIVAGATGLAAVFVEGPTGTTGMRLGVILAAVIAASVTEGIVDLFLGAITPVIRGTGSFGDSISALGPLLVASLPLHVPIIAVLAYAYVHVSPWSAVLFAIPAFAAQRLFTLYRGQRDNATALSAANQRLANANVSFATALVATLDARDQYTAGHSAAVAVYSRDIAARMGLTDDDQTLVHLCGLVHDIGKIGLPVGVLEKPGSLTLEERRTMEHHAEIGERILAKVDDYAEIAAVVRHHHERVDGNGYPDGRMGNEIPLLSRIIAVADAYNAMTSDRPYRDAMPSRVARLRLAQAVETQFDTSVVAAFEAILAGASEEYRSGRSVDFAFETRTREANKASGGLAPVIALAQ